MQRSLVGGVAPAGRRAAVPAQRGDFSWDVARSWLDGQPGGGLNIAHEAVDRHAAGERASRAALRLVHRDGSVTACSYADLSRLSNAFANTLQLLGVGPGDRVFTLLGRRLELYVAVLGTLKNRSVLSPLFSAYGPEPVRQRLALGGALVLVTTRALYRRKVEPVRDQLPGLRFVLLVDGDDEPPPGTITLSALMAEASDEYVVPLTDPEDPALLHFTSGTTGTPKGALHVHEAVVAHHATARYALDLRPDDVFWCTADPGWVTGTSYGVIAPLTHGVTVVVDEEEFEPTRWCDILERERVTVWYTAPTALRMLAHGSSDALKARDLSALRFVASVGEPLPAELVGWGTDTLGVPVHDNWWQTETGGIMIANAAGAPIRPGSMGRPLPGIEAAVLARDEDGEVELVDGRATEITDGSPGILALRPGWPSMFRAYLHDEQRYDACFRGGWYVSGDLVRRDADGWYWFVGRGDDVIKSAGHLIGPFEVESALLAHPAVDDVGVVGRPDPVVGAVVQAFVVVRGPFAASEELRRELLGFGRTRLGAAVAPREIEFVDQIPRTPSGKVLRRVLRDRSAGDAP
jgi:acetyl-CoA synthetase